MRTAAKDAAAVTTAMVAKESAQEREFLTAAVAAGLAASATVVASASFARRRLDATDLSAVAAATAAASSISVAAMQSRVHVVPEAATAAAGKQGDRGTQAQGKLFHGHPFNHAIGGKGRHIYRRDNPQNRKIPCNRQNLPRRAYKRSLPAQVTVTMQRPIEILAPPQKRH